MTTTLDILAPAREAIPAPASRVEVLHKGRWVALCDGDLLVPGRGVAALLPDGGQVAVFRDREGAVHVVGNRDPFTGAFVLSRGLLGSAGPVKFVASPILKQRFDLRTGVCLDDDSVRVPVHAARVAA